MIKTLIAAAAVAAVAFAVAPAQAAHRHHAGLACSGDNLGKTEAAVEAMADNEVKFGAEKEVSLAQDAMLNNKWGACGAHLSKAAEASMAK
ncbi:putative low-complexity protein [Bradyrhizobium sp. USDA 4454]